MICFWGNADFYRVKGFCLCCLTSDFQVVRPCRRFDKGEGLVCDILIGMYFEIYYPKTCSRKRNRLKIGRKPAASPLQRSVVAPGAPTLSVKMQVGLPLVPLLGAVPLDLLPSWPRPSVVSADL